MSLTLTWTSWAWQDTTVILALHKRTEKTINKNGSSQNNYKWPQPKAWKTIYALEAAKKHLVTNMCHMQQKAKGPYAYSCSLLLCAAATEH